MNRERAESHLRLLAEAELRRATTWPGDGGLLDECRSARLELVARAAGRLASAATGTVTPGCSSRRSPWRRSAWPR